MVLSTTENGWIMKYLGSATTAGLMAGSILEVGRTILCMTLGFISGRTAGSTKVSMTMTGNTDMEYILGLTRNST